MDLDQDNKVTLDEMLTYFSVVASMMGEKEFAEAVEEMKMVVNSENAREAMVMAPPRPVEGCAGRATAARLHAQPTGLLVCAASPAALRRIARRTFSHL